LSTGNEPRRTGTGKKPYASTILEQKRHICQQSTDDSLTLPVIYRGRRKVVTVGNERDDYASFLLRLRRSDRNGQPTWRASLESTHDGQRLEFSNLEALVAFLKDRFSRRAGSAAEKEECPMARG
jgi:hypothetical protein